MKEVQAEGTAYIYFTRTDSLPGERVLGLQVRGLDPFMAKHLRSYDDVRLVLENTLLSPGIGQVYYLHWDNGQNLELLDQHVEVDTYTDADFVHSAKTHYQKTRCDGCPRVWDTLVIDSGDPYGAPGLLMVKMRAHARISTCPDCGTRFRQLVVKVL